MSLVRPRFNPEGLLTGGHLESLISYVDSVIADQNRQGGVGVRCGLKVHTEKERRRRVAVYVSPGIAVDQLGRTIKLDDWAKLTSDDRLTGFVVIGLAEEEVEQGTVQAPKASPVHYVRLVTRVEIETDLPPHSLPLAHFKAGKCTWSM